MMNTFELLCGLGALFLFLYYYYLKSTYDFWEKRGVKGPKPSLMTGNFSSFMFGKMSLADLSQKFYNEFPSESMVGVFAGRKPILYIKDLDVIKTVLIKDFTAFADRGRRIHEKVEPLSLHLFNLEPKRWRPLRTRLSPVFTSGKMKEMFHLMLECGDVYEKYLDTLSSRNEPIDVRELAAKFTTDVIGNCAFGLNMNAIADEDSEFRKMGRMIFRTDLRDLIRFRLRDMSDFVYNLVGPLLIRKEIEEFFVNSVKQTMEYRRKNKIVRPDFINNLIDLEDNPGKLKDIELTDELLTAQAFVFFIAGFETSSSTISNALYELALQPSLQDKLREEIRESVEACGGKITYDTIKGMQYLDKVFKETLRKYPVVPVLMRKSMTDYTFENTTVTIPKETKVHIPVFAIQRDPAIYPDPDVFDPERFSEENVKSRHAMSYIPFGDGSRNCIGARFGTYQSKVGLVKTLMNHKVEVCEKTTIPYVNQPRTFLLLAPIDGIFLNVKLINA